MTKGEPGRGARFGNRLGRLFVKRPAYIAGIAASTIVVGMLAWLVFLSVPRVEVGLNPSTDGRWVVSDVPIGARAWLLGVRTGMAVEAFAPSGAIENWSTLAVTDSVVHITVPRHYPPPDAIWFALTIGAVVGSTFAIGVAPSVAWSLLLASTIVCVGVASDFVPVPGGLALALAPPAIGALSVTDRERRLHPRAPLLGVLGVLLATGGWLAVYVLRFESWDVPRELSAVTGIALLVLGTAAVARDGFWRARARLERTGTAAPTAAQLLAATVDELVPGRARSRLLAMERERAAMASDLHADVIPDLAAVIRSVESGMEQADAAAQLRSLSNELRELMTERRLTILEELGLVPALEWLAERVEERTNVIVELDISGDSGARVPPDVELHAYRIAQQALDNALVHARPSKIRISIEVAADRLGLRVIDDGSGISPEAEGRALRAGRLGIADMRQRAAAIGGAFSVLGQETGTMVALRWPA